MRSHTGEKPYKCQHCTRAFARSGDLNKHTRLHVGDNTYACKDCPTTFKYFADLRKHESVHYCAQQPIGEAVVPTV